MVEDVKKKILTLLQKEGFAHKDIPKIADRIGADTEVVYKAVRELEEELRIQTIKKGKYKLTKNLIGRISIIKSGAGFVRVLGEEDVYIKKDNLKNILDGDTVVTTVVDKEKREGKILKVLSHEKDYEVGKIVKKNGMDYVELDNSKKKKILIQLVGDTSELVEGHKITLKLGNLVKDNIYTGNLIKIIGHTNDPGVDILSKAAEFEIENEFSEEALKELGKVPTYVSKEDLIGRKDLRNEEIFTIDGDDAKDLDDAVSLKVLENGHYLLGVHIADVPYYVKEGSAIDKDAYLRGTSSYLADRVLPMLPHLLSNGICSLNPNTDRLTKSCVMEIDKNGNVVSYEIFDSVIHSKKRMTYKKVNDCLLNQNMDKSYEPYIQTLKNMNKLSNIIRKRRESNGSLNFDTKEMKIIVDEFGKAIDIINQERIPSENIIEDFMISANVTVAKHVGYMDLPFVFRVHGEPNDEKIEEFINFIKLMHDKVGKLPKNMHSNAIKQILEDLKYSPNFEIYSNLLLRCMQKAVYSVNNIGHFGLALNHYTHFTSPIRRYPDLMIHRLLNKYSKDECDYSIESLEELMEYLKEASKYSSKKEQNSDNCEREVNKMKGAEYMMDHIGETYTGKITGLSELGIYVDIYNGVEGLLRMDDLGQAWFDKARHELYSFKKEPYRIGDMIEVKVERAIKEVGHVDLTLAKEKVKKIESKC